MDPLFPYLIKYIFRIMHVICFSIVSTDVISYYFTRKPLAEETLEKLLMGSGILLLVSGAINNGLLKGFVKNANNGGSKSHAKIWVSIMHLKTLVAFLLFSPAKKWLPMEYETLRNLQFYSWITIICFSSAARFIRERSVILQDKQKVN